MHYILLGKQLNPTSTYNSYNFNQKKMKQHTHHKCVLVALHASSSRTLTEDTEQRPYPTGKPLQEHQHLYLDSIQKLHLQW